jgi:hypothetical protein
LKSRTLKMSTRPDHFRYAAAGRLHFPHWQAPLTFSVHGRRVVNAIG